MPAKVGAKRAKRALSKKRRAKRVPIAVRRRREALAQKRAELAGAHEKSVVFQWRVENKIAQLVLAKASKIAQGYLSKLEKGGAGQLRLETAAKVCIGAAILCKRPIGERLELETLLSPELAAEYRRKVKDGTEG